jgi:thiamine-phosphate pyrophosphorylase
MNLILPKLYAIVDARCFSAAESPTSALAAHARELVRGGVRLLQYRNKGGATRQALADARELRRVLGSDVQLVFNDRADLCLAAKFDGVHVGQDDLSPADVRAIIGDGLLLGFSTHNPEQVRLADAMPVDYIAVGPVFATASKENPDPVIGLEGVRLARTLTTKPLVAIGGITRKNCRSVIDAGADSVAVISDLLGRPFEAAREFLSLLA